MTPSFKTLSTIAASGMTLYAVHRVLRLIPAVREITYRLLPTATVYDDAYFGAWFMLLMAVVIMTIIIMLKRGKQEPAMPDKSYRIMTYVTTIIAVFGLVEGCYLTEVSIYRTAYLYVPMITRVPLVLAATSWLWLMTRQQGIGRISKALRIVSIIGIVFLCIPISRMIISAVYYCFTGYIILYRSWAVASWMQTVVPAFLLTWYSIEMGLFYHQNNKTK